MMSTFPRHTLPGHGTTGDGLLLILRRERAVATWSHKFDGDQMFVEVRIFGRTVIPPRLYEPAPEDVARLLGASNMKVVSSKAFEKAT
jgi:hypothetical protein